jgi:hypothetical protein
MNDGSGRFRKGRSGNMAGRLGKRSKAGDGAIARGDAAAMTSVGRGGS